MKTIRKLTALLAIGTLVLLTGCAGHSVKGDLPESMQAHLQAHPGDIRFNRPKIVWKVDWDEGRHVSMPYKDLPNRMTLGWGATSAKPRVGGSGKRQGVRRDR